MKRIFMLFIASVVFFSNTAAYAQMTADEIADKANLAAFYQGSDGKANVAMTITDSQGRTRMREFVILRLNIEEGGKQKFYVFFNKPEDVRNMVYMVWKHPGADDDRWLYLPALDLVKRIAGGDKRSSFVGSNFMYEDISGRGTEEDTHKLIEETQEYYKLRNTPKDAESVEFKYFDVWVNKEDFIPYKAEYFNGEGKAYRIIEALQVENIAGFPTVMKSRATDTETGAYTVTEFSSVEYNIGLTEDIFTERYLRRPPARWIR